MLRGANLMFLAPGAVEPPLLLVIVTGLQPQVRRLP